VSVRHSEAFRTIRGEYETVAAALRQAQKSKKKGLSGVPDYDPARLDSALSTAGDAYALLLIATAEGFLRDYLLSLQLPIGPEPKLSTLIDKAYKELNQRASGVKLRSEDRLAMHNLRQGRNQYTHGYRLSVFPSVAKVETVLAKFMSPFP
jgi:hypothetical protein